MSTPSQTDPMLGRLIDGRYQVRSRIARGGMATVYLATDLRLERRVALKVMHSHLADDTNFKTRFVQEARSTARLAHPNVVNVFDQGQDDDMAYLVMEYLPGITLRDLLRDYGKLTPEQTIDIMEAVLSGLAAAHRAGIVHRDLKPENVLLADDGRIKIGDFGLARAATKATGTGQALLGTIAYLSPELVTRGVADTRSDIYAIGIMMYEMLTGEQPFQGEQPMQIAYQHANDSVPKPSLKNPLVPPQLDDLVLWATNRDPEERPADARALLDRLLEAERSVRGTQPAPDGLDATLVLSTGGGLGASATAQTTLLAAQPAFSGPATQVRAEASVTDAVTKLAKVSRRRRGRGWWLFALVLVLASASAGTGWYFGTGPGALVDVPTVSGKTAAAAVKLLHDASFDVTQQKVYNLNVPKGLVVSTSPSGNAQAHKGDDVIIRISQGAKPNVVPKLAGLDVDAARSAIIGVGDQVGSQPDERFSSSVPANTVISASKASDNASLSNGGHYFEGQVVNLVISLGPLPPLDGLSYKEAVDSLTQAGLVPGDGTKRNSQVPKGDVISHEAAVPGPIRKGDTILLDISLGPKLYAVPDVTGRTRDEAKNELQAAGFKVAYSPFWDMVPNGLTSVQSEDPNAKSMQRKGTTITLGISASG